MDAKAPACVLCEAFEEAREEIRTDLLQADYLLAALTPPDEKAQRLVLAVRNRVADALAKYDRLAGG